MAQCRLATAGVVCSSMEQSCVCVLSPIEGLMKEEGVVIVIVTTALCVYIPFPIMGVCFLMD